MTLPAGRSILADALSTQHVASGPLGKDTRFGHRTPADHHLQDVRAGSAGTARTPAATESGDPATVTAPPVAVANFHAGGHELRSLAYPRESDREKRLDLLADSDRGYLDIEDPS